MTGTKKSKPAKPVNERVFSEHDQVPATLGSTPNEANTPHRKPSSNYEAASVLSVSQVIRQFLQELEDLHHTLDAGLPAAAPKQMGNDKHLTPKKQPTEQPPTQTEDQPEQPESTVKSKSPTAIRRGTEEVQPCLFDELQPAIQSKQANPASNPESTKPALKSALKPELDRLVDDLVAQYLPRIEQRLRQELKRLLDK